MSFTPPDAAALKARYPAFATVGDPAIAAMLADVALDVGEGWIDAHRSPAMLALAAHRLAAEGALADPDDETAGSGRAVVEKRAGDTMIRFARPDEGEVIERDGFARTTYGRRFLELRARSFPAIAVI